MKTNLLSAPLENLVQVNIRLWPSNRPKPKA